MPAGAGNHITGRRASGKIIWAVDLSYSVLYGNWMSDYPHFVRAESDDLADYH